MGFPLLVKAVMGGGGKGMKLAAGPEQLLVSAQGAWLVASVLVGGRLASCCRARLAAPRPGQPTD